MHHGVAIASRVPIVEDDRLDWQANAEARHVGVRLPNGVRLENVYIPAGGDVPDREVNPKFGQKLDFLGRMIEWSGKLDCPTILTGVTGHLVDSPANHCAPQTCLHWGLVRGFGHAARYLDPSALLGHAPVRLLPVWNVR